MAQATFSVRMEEGLKEQFDELCREFGMNMSTAINVFAKAVVRERRIPFEIASPEADAIRQNGIAAFQTLREEAKAKGLTDMSLDDINEVIKEVRNNK